MSDLLQPWQPSAADPFDLRKVGHLARRAAVGLSLAERESFARLGPDRAVAALLQRGAGEDVGEAFRAAVAFDDIHKLDAFMVWRLLRGNERVRERMSLFWHGHFATSHRKVASTRLMARQLAVFDRFGLGPFDQLLLEVSRDPAMLKWLDNDSNVKGKPNENFARELFELFALGRGNYTERDIREAARAFTGWHVRDERFSFVRRLHDGGSKEVFGERGEFGGEDIVQLTVRQPACARFLARKLLAAFVHPEPTEAEIDALAAHHERAGRHFGRTLAALLRSRLFFSARAYRSAIKSPVDFAVGLVRSLGARAVPWRVRDAIAGMGQALLDPPSVEGWPAGRAWLTSASWLRRANFAAELFAGSGEYELAPDAEALLAPAVDRDGRVALALALVVDGDVSAESRAAIERFARSAAADGRGGASALLHAVTLLPEAQLL
jgi:uncharacterized protein (DUF1800 family)